MTHRAPTAPPSAPASEARARARARSRPALFPGHYPSAHRAAAHWDARRWPHFSPYELSCGCEGRFCGGAYVHDPLFLDGLEAMRAALGGRPLRITSGHRCPGHNRAVGGAPHSQHLRLAADISTNGFDAADMVRAAAVAGFTGIGIYSTHIHIDRRPGAARWGREVESADGGGAGRRRHRLRDRSGRFARAAAAPGEARSWTS